MDEDDAFFADGPDKVGTATTLDEYRKPVKLPKREFAAGFAIIAAPSTAERNRNSKHLAEQWRRMYRGSAMPVYTAKAEDYERQLAATDREIAAVYQRMNEAMADLPWLEGTGNRVTIRTGKPFPPLRVKRKRKTCATPASVISEAYANLIPKRGSSSSAKPSRNSTAKAGKSRKKRVPAR